MYINEFQNGKAPHVLGVHFWHKSSGGFKRMPLFIFLFIPAPRFLYPKSKDLQNREEPVSINSCISDTMDPQ